jgi:hypothetical protein
VEPQQRSRHLRRLVCVVDGLRLSGAEPVGCHGRVAVAVGCDEPAVQVGHNSHLVPERRQTGVHRDPGRVRRRKLIRELDLQRRAGPPFNPRIAWRSTPPPLAFAGEIVRKSDSISRRSLPSLVVGRDRGTRACEVSDGLAPGRGYGRALCVVQFAKAGERGDSNPRPGIEIRSPEPHVSVMR